MEPPPRSRDRSEHRAYYYPLGTSNWNRIEHRMYSFITVNWWERPPRSLCTIVELISATSTTTGLTIEAGYAQIGIRGPQDHRCLNWPQSL